MEPDSNLTRDSNLFRDLNLTRAANKLGSYNFGFVRLCVNGKTNPVLKRFGFVPNPEQFPLV